MSRYISTALAAALTGLLAAPGWAATANVPFSGLVTATCVLTVGTPGILAPNSDFTGLSSVSGPGATAGTVSALSTGAAFKVSAIAPTAFISAPATGGDNVSFSSLYSGSGATSIGSTPGATLTTLNAGLTNLTIHLTAAKSAGHFNAGAYAAEVVVRCE